MTLKSFRLGIRQGGYVFGNTDHFGETVTFIPREGGAESRIDVHIDFEQSQPDTPLGTDDEERMWVRICTSETCARGGVAVLNKGDVIQRDGDPPELGYRFTGEIRAERYGERECLFKRRRPNRYGPPKL
jgi:hypothetical protein